MSVSRSVMLACGFFALAAGALWFQSCTGQRVTYVTAPVTRGNVTAYVTASGTINPVVTVQVGTYVSGVIQELFCDFNTVVRKDQVCAKIDPRPYTTVVDQSVAALGTARAQLAKDEADLKLKQVVYERTRGLLERGIVSQETLDTALSAMQQARAQVDLDRASVLQHEAQLNAANVNLDYTNIVSPVDGIVVSRNVSQGQTVAASFQTPTLFVIATDLTKMQVDANVSESDIGAVRTGEQTTFTVEAFPNRTFTGRVVQVRQSPQSVQNVVTYDVVSEVPNPELLLKPGMTAAARTITQRRENVLRVPIQALRYEPSAVTAKKKERTGPPSQVWRLKDDKPVAVPVATGLSDDAYVEITKGDLQPGDQVIVSEQTVGGEPEKPSPQSTPRMPRL